MGTPTQHVRRATAALARGEMIVVVDDADREDEGDLMCAAATMTSEQMAFMVRHSTGIVCAPTPGERLDALRLPQMVSENTDSHATAFTVSVDYVGTGTGVSAEDRAATVRSLADPSTTTDRLRRPGHIFPLRARPGGVLVRAGHTEAAVDLLRIGGLDGADQVGVISEILAEDGSLRRGDDLHRFAAEHGLPVLYIADLVRHRTASASVAEPVAGACAVEPVANSGAVDVVASSTMPTAFGEFRAIAYRSLVDSSEHLALIMGDVAEAGQSERGALVRLHSECLTGDIVASLRCDCGAQLEQALATIAAHGRGAVVYLRGHEGRGIGLANKIRAYALQDQGMDTVDANLAQGLAVDSRDYGIGAQILDDLGIRRIRLITDNPTKCGGLSDHGVEIVERVALPSAETQHNVRYLRVKRERMGHLAPATPVGGSVCGLDARHQGAQA